MPYVTSIERLGELRMLRKNILEVLKVRFGDVPDEFNKILDRIREVELLENLHRQAVTIASLEDFETLLPNDRG